MKLPGPWPVIRYPLSAIRYPRPVTRRERALYVLKNTIAINHTEPCQFFP